MVTYMTLDGIKITVIDGVIKLWYVTGVEGYWPTKLLAEFAARRRFPNENWYARVYYRTFFTDSMPHDSFDAGECLDIFEG